jgi:hypothetical protein
MRLKNSSERAWGSLKTKLYLLGTVLLLATALFAYYTLSNSYLDAREARALYQAGQYEKALALAQDVQEGHLYNIMAFSVVEQSRIALRWEAFNDQAREYHKEVAAILAQKNLSPADLLRVRMMAEVLVYQHKKLGSPGVFLPEEMIEEADSHYEQFASLYTQITGEPLPKVSRPSGLFPWSDGQNREGL